jgi:transposase
VRDLRARDFAHPESAGADSRGDASRFENILAEAAPEWVREHADLEWFERYSRRIEDRRLPRGKGARMEYLKTVGTDGIRLLAQLDDPETAPRGLKQLPEEVESSYRIWEQQYETDS